MRWRFGLPPRGAFRRTRAAPATAADASWRLRRQSLAISHSIAVRRTALRTAVGRRRPIHWSPRVTFARGSTQRTRVDIRVGVIGGMATASVRRRASRRGQDRARAPVKFLRDSGRRRRNVLVISTRGRPNPRPRCQRLADQQRQSEIRVGMAHERITTFDRLLLLLPASDVDPAAIVTWLLVTRLLIRPLRRLERAVLAYRPGRGNARAAAEAGPERGNPGTCVTRSGEPSTGRGIGAGNDLGARGPAPAGSRGSPPGEEQPPGRRLAAEHPRPERRHARCTRAYAGISRRVGAFRSFTAIISRKWRRIAASGSGHW